MASCTVRIFSASSSGISRSKASSKAMMSSTRSRESAPRSSTNEAVGVTSLSSTLSWSMMICLTLSSTPGMQTPPVRAKCTQQTSKSICPWEKLARRRQPRSPNAFLRCSGVTLRVLHPLHNLRQRWPFSVHKDADAVNARANREHRVDGAYQQNQAQCNLPRWRRLYQDAGIHQQRCAEWNEREHCGQRRMRLLDHWSHEYD